MGADEPSHLIRLSDDWSLWRTVCLRGAGFPVGLLDRLAFPDAAHAAAQLFDAEKARDAARDAAIAECRRRADALERAAARPFHRVIRKLKKNGTVKHFDGEDALNALLDDYDKAAKHAADTRADAEAVAEEAILEAGEAVRKFAEDPKFLEALVWQNRHVIDTAVEPLLRAPPRQNNRGIREKQRTLVSYLQRYCAKNDSIGFFGPFGWARWESTGPAVSAVPGPDLIAWRDVRLEHWGIAALSDLFVRDPAIRRHLYPRIHPNVRFDHGAILTPKRRFTPAKEIFKLLGACDGRTPAVEIAERVAADPDVPQIGRAHV